jgi:hypothetical protein
MTSELRQRRADEKVAEVWGRVGENPRRFLTVTAQTWPDGEEFTMEQAAAVLNVPAKTVRSWHRNLGRTLRQVDETIPDRA